MNIVYADRKFGFYFNKQLNYNKIAVAIVQNIKRILDGKIDTVGEKKDSTLHRVYGVKLPLLQVAWAGQVLILP